MRPLPTEISKDKEFCQKIHEAFVQNTIEAIKENFAAVEESTNLESKLNLLNQIKNDDSNKSGQNQTAWRPSDSAIDNQAAHDYKSIESNKQRLETEILGPLLNEVNELEKQVSALSYQIADNASIINKIIH